MGILMNLIIGCVIWVYTPDDDFYIGSNGIGKVDYFWIVISISVIERVLSESITVDDYLKHHRPASSWLILHECNKGVNRKKLW